MHLLLDSSGADLICAIADSSSVMVESREPQRSAAAHDIASSVELLMRAVPGTTLTGIVVGLGPGSFIGTRVAISFANGYAAAVNTPLFGVSSLAAIALGQGPSCSLVLRYARRGEYYFYDHGKGGEDTGLLDVAGLASRLQRDLLPNVIYESVETHDREQREEQLVQLCTAAGTELRMCEGVPAEGLRRAGQCSKAQDFIEPVYLRGFL